MVLLGVVGLLQAAFLPGLSLVSLFPAEKAQRLNLFELCAFSFGLSLAFNYVAVLLLTAASLNVPLLHVGLVLVEIALLARVAFKRPPWFRATLLPTAAGSLAALVLLVAAYLLRPNGSSIFWGADELFSWNAWALQWAQNGFPTNTRHYPQLLPIAWSVIYQLLPQPVDFFPKALMPLFSLGIAALFAAFWKLEKKWGPLLGLALAFYLLHSLGWNGALMDMGLADIPSAFTVLLTYYAYRKWRSQPAESFHLVLTGVFAGAAVVTKQGGFAVLPFFLLVFAWDVVARLRKKLEFPLKSWIPFALVASLIAAPWYLYAEHQVKTGRNHYDRAESWLVQGGTTFFEPESTVFERLGAAFDLVAGAVGGAWIPLVLGALCLFGLRTKGHRLAVLLLGLGYSVVWARFLSYDTRNLLPAAPFIALGAGAGLSELFVLAVRSRGASGLRSWAASRAESVGRLTSNPRRNPFTGPAVAGMTALVAVLGLALLAWTCPQARILESLRGLQIKQIGDSSELNKALYAHFGSESSADKIAGYYVFLSALPGLSERYVSSDLSKAGAVESALNDPSIGYILLVFKDYWRSHVSEENMTRIQELLRAGTLHPIFTIPDGQLLRIARSTP